MEVGDQVERVSILPLLALIHPKTNAKLQTSMKLLFYESCQPTKVAAKGAYLAAQRSVRLSPQPGLRSEVPGGPHVHDLCIVCSGTDC